MLLVSTIVNSYNCRILMNKHTHENLNSVRFYGNQLQLIVFSWQIVSISKKRPLLTHMASWKWWYFFKKILMVQNRMWPKTCNFFNPSKVTEVGIIWMPQVLDKLDRLVMQIPYAWGIQTLHLCFYTSVSRLITHGVDVTVGINWKQVPFKFPETQDAFSSDYTFL
jgi:hypothetical protein